MIKTIMALSALILCMMVTVRAQKTYDSVLAKKLGADDYGMRQYVMAFLKKGTVTVDKAKGQELMKGHMANIGRLAAEGKLAVAGPMMDDTGLEGIFVFNVKTVAEAEALSLTDPAVKAGIFTMEYHPWYASAALMQIVDTHSHLQKKSY